MSEEERQRLLRTVQLKLQLMWNRIELLEATFGSEEELDRRMAEYRRLEREQEIPLRKNFDGTWIVRMVR